MKRSTFIGMIMAVSLILGSKQLAHAQQNVDEIMAVFVYNFIEYITWDHAKHDSNFTIGILGESSLQQPLMKIAASKEVNGSPIEIKTWGSVQDIENCHILIVGINMRSAIPEIQEKIKDKNILTIGHHRGFAKRGTGMNIIQVENNVRFEINPTVIEAAKFKISSQLMKLAIIVNN